MNEFEDQSEAYYRWLYENTVDHKAPDFIVKMLDTYRTVRRGFFLYRMTRNSVDIALSDYHIGKISDNVLSSALSILEMHPYAEFHYWRIAIDRELDRRCVQW